MSHARLFFGFSKVDIDIQVTRAVSEIAPRFQHEYGKEEAIGIADVREIQRRALISAGEGVQCFIIQKKHLKRTLSVSKKQKSVARIKKNESKRKGIGRVGKARL